MSTTKHEADPSKFLFRSSNRLRGCARFKAIFQRSLAIYRVGGAVHLENLAGWFGDNIPLEFVIAGDADEISPRVWAATFERVYAGQPSGSGGHLSTDVWPQEQLRPQPDEPVSAMIGASSATFNADLKLHSFNDQPSLTSGPEVQSRYERTRSEWHHANQPHRDGNPALIRDSPHQKERRKEWLYHGVLHNEDGPAAVYADGPEHPDGYAKWYRFGEFHRGGNKPALIERQADNYVRLGYYVNGNQTKPDERISAASLHLYL